MKFGSYISAIKYVSESSAKSAELRQKGEEEIRTFDQLCASVDSLCAKIDRDRYASNRDAFNVAIEVFKKKAKAFSRRELFEYILRTVKTVEALLADQDKYYSDKNKERESFNNLIHYATHLYVINVVFSASDKLYRREIVESIKVEHGTKQKELFQEVYENVKEYIRPTQTTKATPIPCPDGQVNIPREFPEKARLLLGTYENPSGDWITKASEILGLEQTEHEYKELIYKIAEAAQTAPVLSLDISAPTEGNNLLIRQPAYSIREIDNRENVADDKAIIDIIESAVCRYIELLPRISKRVCFIQSRRLSELEAFGNNIFGACKDLVFTEVARDGSAGFQSPCDALKSLLDECKAAKELLTAPCKNLYTYNLQNYSRGIWKQMTLLVIKDYPMGFDGKAVEYLKDILQDANKFGIHVIMTVCDDLLNAAKTQMRDADYEGVFKYFDISNTFRLNGYGLVNVGTYQSVSFADSVLHSDTFDLQGYLARLESYMVNSFDPAIPLKSILDDTGNAQSDARRENFFRVLDLPIGKAGSATRSMKLYQSGGGSPHVVIAGTTGSGKSVLLQDIILSASCHYSPEELEIYLFDFKETPKGFERYKSGFPHVKKIATQCKERDIYELLCMIRNTYTDRMKKAGKAGFTDIRSYNADARKKGKSQIPRLMVVIDEYQTVQSEKCIELLLEIAQKGREFGVVLVMASQSNNPQSFTKILRQFGHRFEFKNEPLGGLISRIESRAQELSGPKGLCFYSNDGSSGIPSLIRCAYVNDEDNDEIEYFKNYISKRFNTDTKYSAYKVGDIKTLTRSTDYDYQNDSFLPIDAQNITPLEGEAEQELEWIAAASQKFKNTENLKDRGFICRLGLNSISLSSVEYKLDRQNPYLVLCGDAVRTRSLEYSVLRSAVFAARQSGAKAGTVAYYIEGDGKYDSQSPAYALRGVDEIKYIAPATEKWSQALTSIHEEYLRRRRAESDADYSPLLVMFASLDLLLSEIEDKKSEYAPPENGSRIDTVGLNLADALDRLAANKAKPTAGAPSAPSVAPAVPQKKDKPLTEKLNALLSADLFKYDIFLCVQTNDISCAQYIKKTVKNNALYSAVHLQKNSAGTLAEEELPRILALTDALLKNRSTSTGKADFCLDYGYKFTSDGLLEFIPYEYKKGDKNK